MTVKTTRFDPAEHLGDADIQTEMLAEAFATGDRKLIVHVLGTIARARGMTQLAEATGIKRENLYVALGENGNPTLETLLKIIGGLEIQISAAPQVPANDHGIEDSLQRA